MAELDVQKKKAGIVRRQVLPLFVIALALFSVRSSVADWNDVPTGSMKPSILEGDRIFVNKLAYDLKVPFTTWHVAQWANPSRGDVVVFFSPSHGTRMVKRVMALPGDVIELSDNRLFINNQPAAYDALDRRIINQIPPSERPRHAFSTEIIGLLKHPMMETPRQIVQRTFGPVTVSPGHYFMLGDNRDNSADSREWGFVPRSQIVGRASRVVMSLDPDRSYAPRWDRFFTPLP